MTTMGISQFSQFSAVLRALSLVHSNMGFCILDTRAALPAASHPLYDDAATRYVHTCRIDRPNVVLSPYQQVYEKSV